MSRRSAMASLARSWARSDRRLITKAVNSKAPSATQFSALFTKLNIGGEK